MKSLVRQTLAMAFGLAITLLAIPAEAVVNELVGSSESHSIEKFNSSGIWLRTFASTGPWIPFGLAVSRVTHDVFVATQMASAVPLTENVILRYTPAGGLFGPGGKYWSTFDLYPYFGVNPVESLLFDSSGNLYVASHYGTSGYQVVIQKFPAAQLLNKTPVPSGAMTLPRACSPTTMLPSSRVSCLQFSRSAWPLVRTTISMSQASSPASFYTNKPNMPAL
jgi:hypothetical protein